MVLTFSFVREFPGNVFMKVLTIHPDVGARSASRSEIIIQAYTKIFPGNSLVNREARNIAASSAPVNGKIVWVPSILIFLILVVPVA